MSRGMRMRMRVGVRLEEIWGRGMRMRMREGARLEERRGRGIRMRMRGNRGMATNHSRIRQKIYFMKIKITRR